MKLTIEVPDVVLVSLLLTLNVLMVSLLLTFNIFDKLFSCDFEHINGCCYTLFPESKFVYAFQS